MKTIAFLFLAIFTVVQTAPALKSVFNDINVSIFNTDEEKGSEEAKENTIEESEEKKNFLQHCTTENESVVIKTATAFLSDNNYKFGIGFSMPLRLSEGRAAYRTAKLKITETAIQQDYTRIQIMNKVKQVFNEQINIKNQIILQEQMYLNYLRLQRAEETRFANGESSLFLINTRENKAIESLQKLVELRSKYFEIRAKLQNAVGVF